MSAACGSCRGQCCYNALIRVTGDDIRRIARAQALATASFVEVVREAGRIDNDFDVSFGLGSPSAPHVLALRHSTRVAGACTFLLLLGNHQPCGIYTERPMVCRVYPMQSSNGRLVVRDDVICRPQYWQDAAIDETGAIDDASWYAIVRQRDSEWRTYERVVQIWNDTCASGMIGEASRYLAYVTAAYDGIERSRTGTACESPSPAEIDAIAAAVLDGTEKGVSDVAHC